MNVEEDSTTVESEAQDQADFTGGFEGKTEKPTAKSDKPTPATTTAAREEAASEPPVQISRKEWDEIRAAAARTASYDKQFASMFGKLGNIYTTIDTLKSQSPRDLKVEMPSTAFQKMAKDFPELAELNREEIQNALANLRATGQPAPDEATIKRILEEQVVAREAEALEDDFPSWREIVGAVDVTKDEKPDPNNAYRKWLATKPDVYQARVNGTMSASVIGRSIRLFQNETKASAKPAVTKPRDDARAERIRGAVQPRGDNAGGDASNSEQAQFEAGFNSR